jgi:hypothetical protein
MKDASMIIKAMVIKAYPSAWFQRAGLSDHRRAPTRHAVDTSLLCNNVPIS